VTFGQYQRLLLVVTIPLILTGVLFGEVINQYPYKFRAFLCEKIGTTEYCNHFGDFSGSAYEREQKKSVAWFDVEDAPSKKPSMTYLASASQRALQGRITSAIPHDLNPPNAQADMSQLVGRNADIVLGMRPKERSNVAGEPTVLRCNSVAYLPDGMFMSRCFDEKWDGRVFYTASGDSLEMLQVLRKELSQEISVWENDRVLYRATTYSMFLVGFLLISSVVWLCRRAFRFVKAG